ncbi:unnamed protein product [Laminaria digitata]
MTRYTLVLVAIFREHARSFLWVVRTSFFSVFFFFPSHLLSSHFFLSLSLHSRHSDPGSQSRLFSPLPNTVRALVLSAAPNQPINNRVFPSYSIQSRPNQATGRVFPKHSIQAQFAP